MASVRDLLLAKTGSRAPTAGVCLCLDSAGLLTSSCFILSSDNPLVLTIKAGEVWKGSSQVDPGVSICLKVAFKDFTFPTNGSPR